MGQAVTSSLSYSQVTAAHSCSASSALLRQAETTTSIMATIRKNKTSLPFGPKHPHEAAWPPKPQ
jgi:hypothetical protein